MASKLPEKQIKKIVADFAMFHNYSAVARMNGVSDKPVKSYVENDPEFSEISDAEGEDGGGVWSEERKQAREKEEASAWDIIMAIIKRGNDAVVRKKGDGYIVLEDKREIRYQAETNDTGSTGLQGR